MENANKIKGVGGKMRKTLYLSKEQIRCLIDSADNLTAKTAFMIGYELALRVSEIQALKVKSINFKTHMVTVWDEKKDDVRIVPMSQRLESQLKLYINEKGFKNRNSPLFPYHKTTFTRWIRRYAKICGIEYDRIHYNLRWHSLRHSRVRHLAKDGYPIAFTMKLTGDTAQTVLQVYSEFTEEDMLKIVREKEKETGW